MPMKRYREVFRLAIPNILSNISVPLIASVDTGLMGHLSSAHLAAVGSSAMIFNFLYWNFGFLRMGTTGFVAQAYGRKDQQGMTKSFMQAVIVAMVISLFLLILQSPLSQLSFQLLNLDGELQSLASSYFNTRIWDAPATLLLYIMMAWFFGNQNAIIPLILTVCINISNISLSILFVKQMDMGIHGVALGSVIANYIGVTIGLIFMWYRYPLIRMKWQDLKTDYSKFFAVNRDIFLRTFLLSITFAFLYSQAAQFGTIILATNVIVLQFTNWMSYAIDGFAYAAEALVGKYKGAQDKLKNTVTIRACFISGAVFAGIFSLVYGVWLDEITALFTDRIEVQQSIQNYKYWIIFFPILGFASYIWDGIFVGLTASRAMRNTMIIAFIIFIATHYLTVSSWGYHGLLCALAVYLLGRSLAQTYVFWKAGFELR